ncbi:hypothetical protein [Commensalibacter nepenthis]|uniref:Uncharacterized protein n=1 Tax=Commensalibacter nepenthis TaxID=3043872 RepID=A0ABT6Q842_9PROT|nr:hypothetical protein [Commensalibacter sp. TBRC 10068]MDI2113067.1 hypothetical protein [Commensalibacter sp. TBRC 10068]
MGADFLLKEINLGVIDYPYSNNGGQSTGSVAKILEDKYEILTNFAARHEDDIAQALTDAMTNAVRNQIQTGKLNRSAFNTAFSQISSDMKQFLSSQEVEKIGIKGVPTQAALKGVSHRFKRKRKRIVHGKRTLGARRPSFIDTGQMESSYIVWGSFK